jgi:ribose transport system ATP-binding protein
VPPIEADPSRATPVVLSVCGVGRRYAGVTALAGVSLDVRGGEVLAIVGENGAGKSTLLKILSGVVQPSEGALAVADAAGALREVALDGVREAARAGIALVHQELNLAENLDVAGAIHLGREPARFGFLDRAKMRADSARWLARVGLDVDPGTLCGSLGIAQRQLVEIAKALSTESRILILDEPTSSLTARETTRLLAIIEELRAAGVAVVFVSHHLDEVMKIADRVVVLRDGRKTGELTRGEYDRAMIERLMVGRDIARAAGRAPRADAPVRLRVESLVGAHRSRKSVSFTVRAGEIVGIAGLVGSGRTELLEAIAGIAPHHGAVRLDGREIEPSAPVRVRAGIAIVPEDRARNGLFLEDSVATNLSLAWIDRTSRSRLVDAGGERTMVERLVARVQLRPATPARRVQTLSGGNQQKSVLGRWLAVDPKVLLLDEPTRGVDVGARAEIHAEVRRLADAGGAVVFASSELEEVLLLADRILVMHEGGIAGELDSRDATEVAIMRLATGGGHAHAGAPDDAESQRP